MTLRRTTAGRAGLALVLLVAPVLLVTGPATAADAVPAYQSEVYAVPVGGLAVTGHGYGHGRGLGQWGSQGAALRGVGYRAILDHYYPGTTPGPLPAPSTLRVLLSGDTDDDVTVRADPGLTLAEGNGPRWALPAGPTAWRVRADPTGTQHVEQLAGGWQPWAAPDGRTGFGQLTFGGAARVRVDLPGGGGRAYRGTVTAARAGGSALDTVNTVPFEQYLYGVVPRESPSSWLPAALQAQAVAARTYSAYERGDSSGRAYDLCDTTACQVYGGSALYDAAGALVELEAASTSAAVNATAGEVRLWGGRPAFTQFSASTGGWSASGGVPYLAARPDPWDDFPGNPVHTWGATLAPSAVEAAYPTVGSLRAIVVTARDGSGEWGGRITSLTLQGVSPGGAPTSSTVTGTAFSSRLGLRSSWWAPSDPVASAITQRWQAIGGAGSVVGAPVSGEYDVPGGRAQDFERGTIFWSAATGAYEVHGDVLRGYLAVGGPGGRFGLPLTGEQPHAGGVRARFAGGTFYWSAATGAQPVEGLVLAAYVGLGEGTGRLGLPVGPEVAVPGGRMSAFVAGRISWSPTTGAHAVYGDVLGRYLALGGAEGLLGLPRADERSHAGGRRQPFTGGTVYWSPATGAHEVHGDILLAYRRLGQAAGALGWPVTDEYAVPAGRRSDFVGGSLVWRAATGEVVRLPR